MFSISQLLCQHHSNTLPYFLDGRHHWSSAGRQSPW
jgi:hypothetical protein